MKAEEAEHAAAAAKAMTGKMLPKPVQQAMRLAAKVMTSVAHHLAQTSSISNEVVMATVLSSMAVAEQYFSCESAMARWTDSGLGLGR